jgi:hypothetical protein
MTRYILHETYEYDIEANDREEALALFDKYWSDHHHAPEVSFTQNYVHIYSTDTVPEIDWEHEGE